MNEFIVMTSAGRVKGRARQYAGKYRNVAVVEVEAGARPFKIDTRLSDVVRIVRHWGACCTGKTALADQLNAQPMANKYYAEVAQ